MSKSITMRAKVAFDYRGAQIPAGATFTPHNAAEAVALKNRKKADFERPSARQVATPVRPSVPVPVPVAPTRALETSQLTADDEPDPGDSPLTADTTTTARGRGRGRGRYQRQDLRSQP